MNPTAEPHPTSFVERVFLTSWRPFAWLAIAVLLTYGHTVFFQEYTYLDDYYLIVEFQPLLRDPGYLLKVFTEDVFHRNQAGMYYRPILSLSLMLDANIGGTNPSVFHFTNIVFHLIGTILVMKLLTGFGLQRPSAFFSSLLFAVHPALAQTVVWIPGRNESLLAIFVLSTLLALLRFQATRLLRWLFLSLLFFLLALFTKETALMLLPLLAAVLIWKSMPRLSAAHYILWGVGTFFILVYWSLLRKAAMIVPLINYSEALPIILKNSWTLIPYLGQIVWPFPVFTVAVGQDLPLVPGLVGLVCLVLILLLPGKKDWSIILFGMAWFTIFLLPSFYRLPTSLYPMRFFEHRVYIAAIGFLFVFAGLGPEPGLRFLPYVRRGAVALVAVGGAFVSFQHSFTFQNAMTFAEQTSRTSPRSTFVHNEVSMMRTPELWLASPALSKRLLSPDDYYNKLREVERSLTVALNLPKSADSNLALGAVYFAMGRLVSAERSLQAAQAREPNNIQAEFNLGVLYYAGHRERLAEQHWQRTVKLDSAFADAHRDLCYLYYSQKQFSAAEYHAERAQQFGAEIPQELLSDIAKAIHRPR
jgi:tetratricopeptide (TPR) repeat protein